MTTGRIVGTVAQLWRFPVKSMQGEPIDRTDLGPRGLPGDRAYALIDTDTGKVASAKSVKLFPSLLECRAAFVEPPGPGGELPPVRMSLPDGTSVTSDSGDVDRVLSKFFRREVRMIRAAPEDFTIDMYHPDRDTFVEQKLGAAFFAQAGLPSPVPAGAFFDLFPVSVLTTSTLERLAEHRPGTRFDPRRLRMNVIVATEGTGFVENESLRRDRRRGPAPRRRARFALRDDDAPAGRSRQGHRGSPDAHGAQQGAGRRGRAVPLRGRVRRGRSAGIDPEG